MPSNWDVDSYKTDFESKEHWELRRNFMLAHKDKLPEDEIVCLAQVFTNIELLGCRYPDETMQKVAELAKGVVESYREKKKGCLKRTFVAASDAAVAKVKGQASFLEVDQPGFSEVDQPRFPETNQPKTSETNQPKTSEPNQPKTSEPNQSKTSEPNQPKTSESNQPSFSESSQPRFSETNQPRFLESKQPRFPEPKQPRFPEPKQPRFLEPKQPRFPEPKQPRFPEPKQPRFPEPKQPRFPEPNQPRFPESKQPRFPEPNEPRFPEPKQPRFPEPNQPRFSGINQPRFSGINLPRFTGINQPRFSGLNLPRFSGINQPSFSGINPPRFPEAHQPRICKPGPLRFCKASEESNKKTKKQRRRERAMAIMLSKAKAKAEKERAEKERAEKERAEKERAEKERAEKERVEKERAEKERAEKERAEKERAERERAEKERAEKERVEKERADKVKPDNVRADTVKADTVKADAVKADNVKIDKVSVDRLNLVSNMAFNNVSRCIWDQYRLSACSSCQHSDQRNVSRNRTSNLADVLTAASSFSYNLDPVSVKRLNNLKPRFVFFLYDEPPVNLLERNASLNKGILRWHFDGQKGLKSCSVYFNGILLGTSEKCSKKQCKEKAAKEAIRNLQGLCYTVKIKEHVRCVNKVTPAALGLPDGEARLKSEIGEQIMKLMGWSGGGLGVKQQGIIQPIRICSNIGRDGLGLTRAKQDRGFRNLASTFLRKWIQTDSDEDLVFSSDFTAAQRETLHKLAADLNLKSRSYGKDQDRYIVIYRKPVPWLIVEKLVRMGGSTNRYELIIPTVTIS